MKTVEISGATLPAVGIGTWHMGSDPELLAQEHDAIQAGIKAGARVIDTAEMYGSGASEKLVGSAIEHFDRSKLFLISKVLPVNASRSQMEHSLDDSLARLGTDYVDLYLLHWRGNVPLAETVTEMERLKGIGKIISWGVSNFDVVDINELKALPEGRNVAANEDLYNLASRGVEFQLKGLQKALGIPLIAYSPLGSGADRGGDEMLASPAVASIAQAHGVTPAQVLLAWAIRDGNTLAIPQTSSPEHMRANIAAADIELSADELNALDAEFPPPTSQQPLDIL